MNTAKEQPAEKSEVPDDAHRKYLLQLRLIDNATRIFIELVRVGGILGFAYLMSDTVTSLAGKKTVADIGIRILGDVRISEAVAWIFGAGGMTYGYSQKKLLKKTHTQMGQRIVDLERRIDPRRTSSHLTNEGDVPPEAK